MSIDQEVKEVAERQIKAIDLAWEKQLGKLPELPDGVAKLHIVEVLKVMFTSGWIESKLHTANILREHL